MLNSKNCFHFYGSKLSSEFPCSFKIGDGFYTSVDQFVTASKAKIFEDFITHNKIMGTDKPRQAVAIGERTLRVNDEEWELFYPIILFRANMAKFSQNEAFKEKLLETENLYLIDWVPDKSDYTTWKVYNSLGTVLMQVREVLR